eukprot:8883696-Prorocentrum_lima.AAC.1
MTSSLVGSEMCIRDRANEGESAEMKPKQDKNRNSANKYGNRGKGIFAVSYTHLTLPTICSV